MTTPTATPSAPASAPSRRQRLATFNARHSHELFSIARAFVDRLAPAFPPVARMIRLDDKTDRFDFACTVSMLCKHADDLSAIAPTIEAIAAHLRSQDFTAAHAPEARAALIGALRHFSGADWNAQHEQDWCEVCNEVLEVMNLPAAGPRAMRKAA